MALPGPRSFPGSTMTDAHSQVTEIPPDALVQEMLAAEAVAPKKVRQPVAALLVAAGLALGSAQGAEIGIASFYGGRHHGRPTASGRPFDQNAMTAAHRTLPLGSRVRVTVLTTGPTFSG